MQHECIPQAILGMDVICQAKSGMGKTAVFVLAVLQQLEPVPGRANRNTARHVNDLQFNPHSQLSGIGILESLD